MICERKKRKKLNKLNKFFYQRTERGYENVKKIKVIFWHLLKMCQLHLLFIAYVLEVVHTNVTNRGFNNKSPFIANLNFYFGTTIVKHTFT